MADQVRASERRPYSKVHTTRISRLMFLWTLLAAPTVVASVLPPIARSDLNAAISLPQSDSFPSGEIVGNDPDVSHSSPPQERAQWDRPFLRDVILQLENNLEERAGSLPILLAEDEEVQADSNNTRTDGDSPFSLARRSTDSTPTPFDTSLARNFSSSTCPKFFKEFLANSTVTSCHAVSMLLRNSNAFFQTLRSAAATSHVLDLSCGADVNKCSAIMSDLATRILKTDACGKDYDDKNPLVQDAYTSMITYEPIYRSTCLKNPKTTDYCFVDAVTNSSSPADYDAYFIPFGSALTDKPYPTCNQCLQASMDIYSDWAKVDGQPLVRSYISSAKGINSKCGANFVNANVTVGSEKIVTSGAWSSSRPDMSVTGYVAALSIAVTIFGLL